MKCGCANFGGEFCPACVEHISREIHPPLRVLVEELGVIQKQIRHGTVCGWLLEPLDAAVSEGARGCAFLSWRCF